MEQVQLQDWARYTPAQRFQRYGYFALTALVVAWALGSVNIIWAWVWDARPRWAIFSAAWCLQTQPTSTRF